MAVAAVGEDDFVWCTSCDYAANVEAATRGAADCARSVAGVDVPRDGEGRTRPTCPGIDGVARVPRRRAARAAEVHRVRRRRRARARARARRPRGQRVRAAAGASRRARSGCTPTTTSTGTPSCPKGYIGPHLPGVDGRRRRSVGRCAARVGHRRERARPPRAQLACSAATSHVDTGPISSTIVPGDPCPRCGEPLSVDRGIEVGHVFQLGTKYSEALDARYTDEAGRAAPDADGLLRHRHLAHRSPPSPRSTTTTHGLAWPEVLAPYDVHLVAAARAWRRRRRRCSPTAERTRTTSSTARGVSVLYDDRDASPGVKFADADLLGMPVQRHRRRQGSRAGRRRAPASAPPASRTSSRWPTPSRRSRGRIR